MNRPDISRLRKNRFLHLNIGFIIAISLSIMGFNYTVYDDPNAPIQVPVSIEEEEIIDIVRTVHPERKQPPPAIQPSETIVEPEVEFIEVPEPVEPLTIDVPKPAPAPEPAPYVAPPAVKPAIVEKEEEDIKEIFTVVEQMPRFTGCEDSGLEEEELKKCAEKKMLEFVYSHVKYPALAREHGIEGTVLVTFVVEKDGSIKLPKVIRDIGGGCATEVVRVVKKMPEWIPGEQRGRKVRVQFSLPVKFSLE